MMGLNVILMVFSCAQLLQTNSFPLLPSRLLSRETTTFARRLVSLSETTSSSPTDYELNGDGDVVLTSPMSLTGVRTLGVDFGLARTGLGLSNGYAPRPLSVLRVDCGENTNELSREIVRVAAAEKVDQIVVGLPLHKNGTLSEQADVSRTFARSLAAYCRARFGPDFTVWLFDERYSSKAAAARIRTEILGRAGGSSGRGPNRTPSRYELSGTLDAESACVVLEHFYATNGEGRRVVEVPEDVRAACDAAWRLQREEERIAKEEAERIRETTFHSKRELMERAQRMEQKMREEGTLKVSKKKKKKKKKK